MIRTHCLYTVLVNGNELPKHLEYHNIKIQRQKGGTFFLQLIANVVYWWHKINCNLQKFMAVIDDYLVTFNVNKLCPGRFKSQKYFHWLHAYAHHLHVTKYLNNFGYLCISILSVLILLSFIQKYSYGHYSKYFA